MPLHNEKPNADRLDKVARRVLAAAIDFERARAEKPRNTYGDDQGEKLCEIVAEYRQALVAELIGAGEPELFPDPGVEMKA